jgi:hypothetical protein
MDIGAGDTLETVDVRGSSLVIYDEKRIFETTWRVGVTISNIHTSFLEEVVLEGNIFAFVVPFYCRDIFREQQRFTL